MTSTGVAFMGAQCEITGCISLNKPVVNESTVPHTPRRLLNSSNYPHYSLVLIIIRLLLWLLSPGVFRSYSASGTDRVIWLIIFPTLSIYWMNLKGFFLKFEWKWEDVVRKKWTKHNGLKKNHLAYIIRLETKSSRILPLTYVTKYDMT